ncbi:hypothetical protein HY772_07325 [Candidatus Woesearchaeota archaeon]|nr:hypothetical protein [Candidatus Woesearchaeota archaeon]
MVRSVRSPMYSYNASYSTHYSTYFSQRGRCTKAQADANAAATLVALLALLIIFYLLFIPPEFRDQILEGNQTTTTGPGTGGANDTLLLATPGTLSPLDTKDIEHNIGAVYLFAKENAKILETRSNLYVRTTFMRQERANVTFAISDFENTDNVLLTFRATTRSKGRLVIRLNGNEIFNGPITQENVEPLRLAKSSLLQGKNTLEFESSRVGWLFWRVHEFGLQTVQISADVTDVTQQRSQNSFIVSATEKNNVQRSVLRFAPDCEVTKVGKLDITINGHSVYSTLPDCGGKVTIEFTPDILREGENLIIFRTEKGNYLVDLTKITSEMKQITQPVFYFDITQNTINDLKAGRYSVELRLKFLDSKELKTGKINFNGHETNIYQKEADYKRDITDWLVFV